MFNDDDFFNGSIEELFNKLSGEGFVEYSSVSPDGKRRTIKRGKRNVFGKIFLNKVIDNKRIYLLFDLSGRKKISAKVKNDFSAGKYAHLPSGNKLLEVKEDEEIIFEYPLEEKRIDDFNFTFNNGLLEVSFKK